MAIDGGVHLQGALIEVDVLPPDGTDLPDPHASGHREHVQGFEMRLDRRSSEKSPGIGPVKNYPVTPGDGWPQHSRAAGVAGNAVCVHRVLKGGSEDDAGFAGD